MAHPVDGPKKHAVTCDTNRLEMTLQRNPMVVFQPNSQSQSTESSSIFTNRAGPVHERSDLLYHPPIGAAGSNDDQSQFAFFNL